jgi:hypothetical protein
LRNVAFARQPWRKQEKLPASPLIHNTLQQQTVIIFNGAFYLAVMDRKMQQHLGRAKHALSKRSVDNFCGFSVFSSSNESLNAQIRLGKIADSPTKRQHGFEFGSVASQSTE